MAETWRVVLASGEVREVRVVRRSGEWSAEGSALHGIEFGVVPWAAVVRLTLRWPDRPREILAPGEPTRAELAAQLAAVTAERDGLIVDHRAASTACGSATLRAGFFADIVREVARIVDPRDGEAVVEAAQRVTAERDALRAERDGEHDLIARQEGILTAVANALKGAPPALRTHSHHDLGAVAAATVAQQAPLVACVDALRAAATAAGWRDADATGETLVAWVRRGAMQSRG